MVFNSDLARKKFFASKVDRKPYYAKYFYPKGTKSKYDNSDISGWKIKDSGDIVIKNPTANNSHTILARNKKDFDRILDNLHDPHSASGSGKAKHSNKRVIITGKNKHFKPNIVNQKEFREMVSRAMSENYLWKSIAENKGEDTSKLKTVYGFPLTDDGLMRQRKAMQVGVIPLNPKKR